MVQEHNLVRYLTVMLYAYNAANLKCSASISVRRQCNIYTQYSLESSLYLHILAEMTSFVRHTMRRAEMSRFMFNRARCSKLD